MEKNKINISKIETFLYGIIDNVVSDNTYVGTLPDTIDAKWKDMCLIDCSNSVQDYEAYGEGIVHILLYAKPLTNGSKNVAVMSKLEAKLNEVIDKNNSREYQFSRLNTYTDYDAKRKWHCNIVALVLKIF